MNARSIARPYVRRIRRVAKAAFNDVNRVVGTRWRVHEPLEEQWRRILGRSRDVLATLPPVSAERVLIATSYGFAEVMLALESTLGMALRLRGADPIFLACDKALPSSEWNVFGNHRLPTEGFTAPQTPRARLDRCQYCTEQIMSTHGQLPLPLVTFQRHLLGDDYPRVAAIVDALAFEEYGSFVYRGIHVGEHAYASTMRVMLRGSLIDNAETRFVFRRYLFTSILIVDLIERVFAEVKPDRVLSIHGIYVTHGTICEVARRDGIPVVVYGVPYRKGTLVVSHNDTYHKTLVSEPTSQWETLELTPRRAELIDTYLRSRRFGHKDNVSYNSYAIEDREQMVRELKLDPSLPIISLYTNVIWDAQLYYNYTAFSNILEWVKESIRYFAGRPDLQLVIRVHPAEVQGLQQSAQPIDEEIRRDFPQLPPNVHVIPPTSRLSSYTLAEMSRASIIYGTKMGVEIAAMGTPLIVAGETFNRGKGYSYDVETREQYFALLDRVLELPRNSPEMVERARKYAYHFFYRRMIDLPLFNVADGFRLTKVSLTFDDLNALAPGKVGALDHICQGIMDGVTPFVYDSLDDSAATVHQIA